MSEWAQPPAFPGLEAGVVHVWSLDLAACVEGVEGWRAALAPDELVRADRYRFDHPRQSYIAARTALRHLLSRYLGTGIGDIAFDYEENGKPYLRDCDPKFGLRFNVSHSKDQALLAFVLDHRIGVDIERRREMHDMDGVAEISFSPRELASYRALESNARIEAFFNGWARKEAVIKALGRGLTYPLKGLTVSIGPAEAPCVESLVQDESSPEDWTLVALDAAAGYAAALAVDCPRLVVRTFSLDIDTIRIESPSF